MTEYLLLIAGVYTLNLLPAFGPPTWTLLVFFTVRYDLAIAPTILLGAMAAAAGRYTLASGARLFRGRLTPKRTAELDALRDAAEGNRSASYALLGLFALSPVPSAQLFVAAGLTGVRLLPLTIAFFSGRLVSYTIYVTAAKTAKDSVEQILREGWGSPWSIALQAAMLVFLAALLFAPWSRLLRRWLPNVPKAESE
jgi:uncharacterized membrane protein YdjX (TVP38/TMEM64 family)